ncbi:MarR family winged helix-turn-helix transcriptional regulator [Leptospira borgpetersenii]|uniref:MarR family protein n=1 Tax=Leptospira borgpetersenii serovar Pomona str. 200901868 TaxID=1192866 RepID=M6WBG2_LEPBO|nr:MarR family winged helix-turn-helix transcriptional regulator [Leptospira borgpetersenii]EMO64806.1 MarR family protein [Leptospira borgpetersenii serovar Pomona str. 200901868]MBE8365387.1 winged helix-turn-helix transcriptional regulator [Leptospira borgpetersenii serovar Balcanica]MBE8366288.1 winged helix-turn-helix transcriptional regulator [Leptospira borgpetersenii serovar Balcanica]MBE8399067.1 winged helix-turn-helix transcriptional regulator [Leptospira borgpetersenii serovar Taras
MKSKSIFSELQVEESTGFLFWQITNLWQKRIRENLLILDLTHVQFVLLASLAWFEETSQKATQVRLAEHAKTDVMMTSKVLRSLESKKLLTRQPDPEDSRANCLFLTLEGKKLVEKAVHIVESTDKLFFSILKDEKNFRSSLLDLRQQNA